MVAAETVPRIAEHHPALDADAAYVMALLHDIGRTTGGPDLADVRHVLDGYRSMLERGFDDSARICLTHSFPIKQADAFAGRWIARAKKSSSSRTISIGSSTRPTIDLFSHAMRSPFHQGRC